MEKNRKWGQILPNSDNPQFLLDGKEIYLYLREKYPESNIVDLDNILNALCVSLIILIKNNVDESDYKEILQLIWNILNKNL